MMQNKENISSSQPRVPSVPIHDLTNSLATSLNEMNGMHERKKVSLVCPDDIAKAE